MSTLLDSPDRPRPAITRLSLPLLFVLALLLSGCAGSEQQPVGSTDPGQHDGSTGPAFPVRIEHKYGTTEITDQPERVVTVGYSDHEPLLALGVRPVGTVDWFGERPFGAFPWAQPLWSGTQPEIVGQRDDLDFDKIIALKPDLIIGLYTGMDENKYRMLSKIAPTVAQSKDHPDYLTPWQDMTRVAGQAVGQAAKAGQLIDEIDQKFAAARAAHPEFAGKSVAVADSYQPGKYAVFTERDPKVQFLTGLGFTVSQEITDLADGRAAAEISSERLDLVDVDRLLWLTADPSAEQRINGDKLYQLLKVKQEGRALFVPYSSPPVGAAMSFNTVLSIPYALDQLVPLLTANGR